MRFLAWGGRGGGHQQGAHTNACRCHSAAHPDNKTKPPLRTCLPSPPPAPPGSPGLTSLDLSRNNMDDAAVGGIMDALRANEAMALQVGRERGGGSGAARGFRCVARGTPAGCTGMPVADCPALL